MKLKFINVLGSRVIHYLNSILVNITQASPNQDKPKHTHGL